VITFSCSAAVVLLLIVCMYIFYYTHEWTKRHDELEGENMKLKEQVNLLKKNYQTCSDSIHHKYPRPSPYAPPDFERMYPDIFGPRPIPLKPGKKVLVAGAVGRTGASNIDHIITTFGTKRFTYILFHYDDTDWTEYFWNREVIHITMHKQMKWWYIKRFINPEIASFYDYIYILDEDCIFPDDWNNEKFMSIARRNKLDIFQPSHNNSLHDIIKTQRGSHAGRYTDFVEVGPFTIFSKRGFECVWNILLPDAVGGWGYDLFFASYCNMTMGIIDSMPIYHADKKSATLNRHDGAENEQAVVLERYKSLKHVWFGSMSTKDYFY